MRKLTTPALVALLLAAVSGCAATGAGAPDFPDNTLTVVGIGRVSIAPDTAVLSLGVTVRAPSVVEATAEATRRMSAVLAQVKGLGVAESDITTLAYSVDPRTSVSRPDEPARVVGYQVLNLAQVTVRRIETAGAILDAATAAGANVVREVHFTRSDVARIQAEARAAAVSDALAKARQLAAAAGVKLGDAVAIRESPTGRPIMRGSGMGPAGAAPPMEPGQLEIVVSIELRQSVRP